VLSWFPDRAPRRRSKPSDDFSGPPNAASLPFVLNAPFRTAEFLPRQTPLMEKRRDFPVPMAAQGGATLSTSKLVLALKGRLFRPPLLLAATNAKNAKK
jgi:hypothetical protein